MHLFDCTPGIGPLYLLSGAQVLDSAIHIHPPSKALYDDDDDDDD